MPEERRHLGATQRPTLKKYAQMQGVLFDLKDIVPGADKRIGDLGLESRCRTEHADFVKAVPKGGNVYFMKHILHDWTDEQATTILRNLWWCKYRKGGPVSLYA